MGEPDPRRDPGPYETEAQARAQFEATALGIPGPDWRRRWMTLLEPLAGAGVVLSEYEQAVVKNVAVGLDDEDAQVLAGFILRAWKAGRDSATGRTA